MGFPSIFLAELLGLFFISTPPRKAGRPHMLCRSEQPPSLDKTDKTCSSFPSSSLELTLLLFKNPEPPLVSALLSVCFMNAQELAPFWKSFITTFCWANAKPVKMQGEEIRFFLFYRKEQSPGPTGFLIPPSVAWADQLQWLTPMTEGPVPSIEPGHLEILLW